MQQSSVVLITPNIENHREANSERSTAVGLSSASAGWASIYEMSSLKRKRLTNGSVSAMRFDLHGASSIPGRIRVESVLPVDINSEEVGAKLKPLRWLEVA